MIVMTITPRTHWPSGSPVMAKYWSFVQIETILTLYYCRIGTNIEIIKIEKATVGKKN